MTQRPIRQRPRMPDALSLPMLPPPLLLLALSLLAAGGGCAGARGRGANTTAAAEPLAVGSWDDLRRHAGRRVTLEGRLLLSQTKLHHSLLEVAGGGGRVKVDLDRRVPLELDGQPVRAEGLLADVSYVYHPPTREEMATIGGLEVFADADGNPIKHPFLVRRLKLRDFRLLTPEGAELDPEGKKVDDD